MLYQQTPLSVACFTLKEMSAETVSGTFPPLMSFGGILLPPRNFPDHSFAKLRAVSSRRKACMATDVTRKQPVLYMAKTEGWIGRPNSESIFVRKLKK